MITAILIEDEANNRELLENMLTHYVSDIDILGWADSVQSGISLIQESHPQIVFLDIEIKGGTGFDILQEFPKQKFSVIFTTGYDQYAIKAIKHSAIDYLLKPISLTELREAVDRARKNIADNKENEDSVLFISGTKANRLVRCHQIEYIELASGYTSFYLDEGTRVTSSYAIDKYSDALPSYLRKAHRSYVVNINKIEKLDFGRGGFIHLLSGKKIPVSYRKKSALKKLLQSNN